MKLLSFGQPDPLDAARVRHERGRERLRDVQTALDDFRVLHERGSPVYGQPIAYQDPDTSAWRALPFYGDAPLPLTLAMSEMLYNLKVSLDYVTYELFVQALGKGRISRSGFKTDRDFIRFEKSVQFPIMDTPEKAKAWHQKTGYWLTLPEWTAIAGAQPYRRKLMRFLGDEYHNLDKHRGLQEPAVILDFTNAVFRDTGAITVEDAFKTEAVPPGLPVYVYANCAAEVTLANGAPVVETLQKLESEVGALIDALALAFQ